MPLTAVTDERESAEAIWRLKATLEQDAVHPMPGLWINTPGGGTTDMEVDGYPLHHVPVMWHPHLKLWAYVDYEGEGRQFWCNFGMRDPRERHRQPPVLQINPPVRGRNFLCAGVLACDEQGRVHYLHSGRIGGGPKGVNRTTFVGSGFWPEEQVEVTWPGGIRGVRRQMYDLGRVDDERIVRRLAKYVRAVAIFKFLRNAYTAGEELRPLFRDVPGIFLSHAGDRKWCQDFVGRMGQTGADIFYDDEEHPPETVDAAVRQAIAERPVFVLALSAAALASPYVGEQLRLAVDHYRRDPLNRIILPVKVAPCSPPAGKENFVYLRNPGDTPLPAGQAAARVADVLTRTASTGASGAGVFLSHSSADNAWCEDFRFGLEKGGADVWYDEERLRPGPLDDAIRQAIAERPVFVLALSAAALASPYVRQEVGFAIEYARRIVLVVASPCEIPAEWANFPCIHGERSSALSAGDAAIHVQDLLAAGATVAPPTTSVSPVRAESAMPPWLAVAGPIASVAPPSPSPRRMRLFSRLFGRLSTR